ncbi:MAG: cellulase family glycosylhydrolase [Chloroflexi bacterium]|nr:cellulase family glycosylhydrolase [Chloroflexota bacterium]
MSDNSRYIADVTIPDDTQIEAGKSFIKTWRVHNNGSTNWDRGYQLVFVNGSPMGSPTKLLLPTAVPGQQVDISLYQTAPASGGKYFGDWRLRNPQGEFFGELLYLRILVPEPEKAEDKPLPTSVEISWEFEPDKWRDTIWAITSIFESGSPEGNPSAYQTYDAGVISYGKHQATLASGTLNRVAQAYFQRSQSDTAKALQKEYGARITQMDQSLRNDGRIKQLLLQAANEAAMAEAQDAVFEQSFYQPAIAAAREYNVVSPLGLAALYDTQIQGGLYIILSRVTERLGGKIGQNNITETAWLATYLDLREDRLNRLADQFQAKGDNNTANALRVSTYRVQEHRKLLQAGNLTLAGTLNVRGRTVTGIGKAEDKGKTDEQRPRPDMGINPPPDREDSSPPVSREPTGTSNAAFVADVTIPDDTEIPAGQAFTKTWRVRNSGTRAWGNGFTIEFVQGDPMGAARSYPLPATEPAQTADISLPLTAPQTAASHHSDWKLKDDRGQYFGELVYLRITVTPKAVDKPVGPPLQIGMNINPDAPHSNPLAEGELKGMDWTRWVFKLAARHNPAERQDIGAAFRQFDPLVKGYMDQGVGSLIVLNQETVWGNAPWDGNNDWTTYANQLAAVAGQIASRYKKYGDKIAYEIWNEGDLPDNPASVYVPPEQFAIVLKRTAKAIRSQSPASPLVFGGLASGPIKGIPYLQTCKQALGGMWPVDAIGIHPYGRWGTKAPFDWAKLFPTLGDAFDRYEKSLPEIKLWITEIGVADNNVIGSQHYADIGMYIQNVHETIASEYTYHVPVIIWFAWSDLMRNAGIVDNQGQRKSHVYEAFVKIRERKF